MEIIDPRFRYSLINFFADFSFRGADRLAKITSDILMPNPKGSLIIKTIHGFKIKIDPFIDNGVERILYQYGTYEKGTLSILDAFLRKGDLFIDVGANIGLMSIFASYKVGSSGNVWSFEANPVTKNILNENIALNKLTNVTTFGIALGSTHGTSTLYSNLSINRGSASLNKFHEDSETFEVDLRRLDEIAGENDKIRLIKVDVEGWELEVLKGSGALLSGSSAPAIIVECSILTSDSPRETVELYDFLKTVNNYRIFKLAHGKSKISKLTEVKAVMDLPDHDNLFCFLDDHIKSIPSSLFRT